jgi:hypothetical protein
VGAVARGGAIARGKLLHHSESALVGRLKLADDPGNSLGDTVLIDTDGQKLTFATK